MLTPELSPALWYGLLIAVALFLAYRVAVALAFGLLAKRMGRRFNVSSREAFNVALASFLDTALGLLVLAMSVFTREMDVASAKRLVERITSDSLYVVSILSGVDDYQARNLARDAQLLVEKLEQAQKSPTFGRLDVIEELEVIEQDLIFIRDKADDISLAEDQKLRSKLLSECVRRMDSAKDRLEKLLEKLQ